MKDKIIRAIAKDGSVRVFVAVTTNLVQKAREIHHTSPVASAALGRLLTAAAMMGAMLKGPKDTLTLQIKGDGPLGGVLAVSDSACHVKGYVYEPQVEIPLKRPGKLDVGGAIGKGHLSVVKDIGLKEPYAGMIDLVSGEIAEDLTFYFTKSEQTPSSVGLGVLVDVDTSIKQAGGFIVQVMPDAQEETIAALEKNLLTLASVTQLLEEGLTGEDILEKLFLGIPYHIIDTLPTKFDCDCSRKRVEKALLSLGAKELENMIEEDKKASLHCHFCNKEYDFTKEELEALLEEAK